MMGPWERDETRLLVGGPAKLRSDETDRATKASWKGHIGIKHSRVPLECVETLRKVRKDVHLITPSRKTRRDLPKNILPMMLDIQWTGFCETQCLVTQQHPRSASSILLESHIDRRTVCLGGRGVLTVGVHADKCRRCVTDTTTAVRGSASRRLAARDGV